MKLIFSIIFSILVASCGGGGDSATSVEIPAPAPPSVVKFTKIDSNGNVLPSTTANWVCTLDNTTGLMWEVKTNDGGLRDKKWVYTANETTGTNGDGSCDASKTCNQSLFRDAVNAQGLCGYKNWRLAQSTELQGLHDITKTEAPYIDTAYFPFTVPGKHWTGTKTTILGAASVSWVDFSAIGWGSQNSLGSHYSVRLVRP